MKKNNTLLDFQDLLNKKSLLEQTADFLSFKINEENEIFLIRLEEVLKIGKIDHMSTLGICKDYFVGIVNLNNIICSLLDLNKILFSRNLDDKKLNKEMILLRNENNYALSCLKINSVISKTDLIKMPTNNESIKFIDKEYMHRDSGMIYKEINVNKMLQFDDLKNTFKSF